MEGQRFATGPGSLNESQNRIFWSKGEGRGLGLGFGAFHIYLSPPSVSEPGGLFGILQSSRDLPLTVNTIAPSSDFSGHTFGRTPHTSHIPALVPKLNACAALTHCRKVLQSFQLA